MILGGEKRAVTRTLERLHEQHTPIRVEIEKLGIRFRSNLSLRKGVVAISRPMGFNMEIPAGSTVRFKVPEKKDREIQLAIANPNFQMANGRSFFICGLPEKFAPKTKRKAERFRTSRFKNLMFHFPEMQSAYRIIDLSLNGCRIATRGENLAAVLTEGEPIQPAEIRIGESVQIELGSVIPRAFRESNVGLQFDLGRDQTSKDRLEKLLQWLEDWENKLSRFASENQEA